MNFELSDYLWKNRIVIMFSPDQEHASYRRFLGNWQERALDIQDRDLILVTVLGDGRCLVGNTPGNDASRNRLVQRYGPIGDSFEVLLIGKDGTVKLRKNEVSLDQIFVLIDSMPMRRQEMQRKERAPGALERR